jgi:sulfotransferase
MNNNIVFLSGLPRTGSTLLTSILSQNPNLYSNGNSGLCQVMWDAQMTCRTTEQLQHKRNFEKQYVSKIPNIFYEGINKTIIDKCRSWTLPANLQMIYDYMTDSPKIIVMLRSLVDILKSFVYVRTLNSWHNPEIGLLDPGSEPLMRSLEGVMNAQATNVGQFLFLTYEDLIFDTNTIIRQIYEFCGWDFYGHRFKNVTNTNVECEEIPGLIGLHDVRSTISRRVFDVKLSDELLEKATQLDNQFQNVFCNEPLKLGAYN